MSDYHNRESGESPETDPLTHCSGHADEDPHAPRCLTCRFVRTAVIVNRGAPGSGQEPALRSKLGCGWALDKYLAKAKAAVRENPCKPQRDRHGGHDRPEIVPLGDDHRACKDYRPSVVRVREDCESERFARSGLLADLDAATDAEFDAALKTFAFEDAGCATCDAIAAEAEAPSSRQRPGRGPTDARVEFDRLDGHRPTADDAPPTPSATRRRQPAAKGDPLAQLD